MSPYEQLNVKSHGGTAYGSQVTIVADARGVSTSVELKSYVTNITNICICVSPPMRVVRHN